MVESRLSIHASGDGPALVESYLKRWRESQACLGHFLVILIGQVSPYEAEMWDQG